MEEDRSWEQAKGAARSRSARSTLTMGSSVKRGGAQEGAGRKRKKLKYEIVEDDWGEEVGAKTTPGGAREVKSSSGASKIEGAGGLKDGGAVGDHPDHPGEDVGGDHPANPKASSAQPSAEQHPTQPPDRVTELVEQVPSRLLTRTEDQLCSPRCKKGNTLEDFLHPKTFVSTLGGGGGSEVVTDYVEWAPMTRRNQNQWLQHR